MFSTPRRKIHVYSGKENETPRILKSIGKEVNYSTRIHCRTPLGTVNRKTNTHNQLVHVKDGTGKQKFNQRRSSKSKRCDNEDSENKTSFHTDSFPVDVDIMLDDKQITKVADNPVIQTSLSLKESVSLLSSAVSPVHEDSSSVVSLTSLDSRDSTPAPGDGGSVDQLVEYLVGEAIQNAVVQLVEENCHSEELELADEGMCSPCLGKQEIAISTEHSSASKVSGETEDKILSLCSDGSPSSAHNFSDIPLDVACNISCFLEESEIKSDLTDSACFSDENVSLESFLSQPSLTPEGGNKIQCNALLSVTPSKVLKGTPRLLPASEIEHVPHAMFEFEIAKSAGNLWDLSGSYQERKSSSNKVVAPFITPLLNFVTVHGDNAVAENKETISTPCASPDIAVVNRSCGSSPMLLTNQSAMTTPLQTINQQTGMTPTICSHQSCNTIPVSVSHTSTVMTPQQLIDQSCGTSPKTMVSIETETHQQNLHDIGVGESVAMTRDAETQRTPSQIHDKECSTSPTETQNACQMTSPVLRANAETATTPISASPIRLGNFSRKSENSVALMDQMKTSHISNKLLRREVSALRKHKTKWEEHLQREQAEMKRKMSLICHEKTALIETKQTAKLAAQREIDDLLAQLGEQLTQIADLEGNLQKKDEDIAKLQRLNDERRNKYCDEIKELQDDLCLAYKQHETEVTELKDQLEQHSCYERLYHKAIDKTRSLEEELGTFTRLEDSLMRAAELQEKMPVVEETFLLVKSLFDQTSKEKSILAQKTKELMEQTDKLKADEEEKLVQQERLLSENKSLIMKLEEENKKLLFVEAEMERIRDQCQDMETTKARLEMEMKNAVTETERLKCEKETLEKSLETLQNEKQREEAHRHEMEERISGMMEEMRSQEKQSSEIVNKLKEENERLTRNEELLKLKVSEATQSIENLKDQLKKSEESKEFVNQERESIEEYVKELEGKIEMMRKDLVTTEEVLQKERIISQEQDLAVQSLQEYFRNSQSELEHTKQRAHGIIIQQGAQISSASTALADLVARLDHYDSEVLNQRKSNPGSMKQNQPPQPSSFVFSILNSPLQDRRASSDVNVTSASPSSQEESSPNSSAAIGQSESSAFSVVTPAKSAVSPDPAESESSMAELVQKVNDHFNHLMEKVLRRLECAGQTIQDQEMRRQQLFNDFQKTKKQHSRELEEFAAALRSSEEQVRYLKKELRSTNSRTCDDRERLREALERMENGGHVTKNHRDVERMQREVERLSEELQNAERERRLYQDQVTSLKGLMSVEGRSTSAMNLVAKIAAENTQLKRDMRVLEENWQKAEAEVKSLDSLFDQCVNMLEKVPQTIRDKDSNLKILSRTLLSS